MREEEEVRGRMPVNHAEEASRGGARDECIRRHYIPRPEAQELAPGFSDRDVPGDLDASSAGGVGGPGLRTVSFRRRWRGVGDSESRQLWYFPASKGEKSELEGVQDKEVVFLFDLFHFGFPEGSDMNRLMRKTC